MSTEVNFNDIGRNFFGLTKTFTSLKNALSKNALSEKFALSENAFSDTKFYRFFFLSLLDLDGWRLECSDVLRYQIMGWYQ